jgi:hypothetical protein
VNESQSGSGWIRAGVEIAMRGQANIVDLRLDRLLCDVVVAMRKYIRDIASMSRHVVWGENRVR